MSDLIQLTRQFSQSDFDRFAALSGDDNSIHVDPEAAAQTRFGRTVAHGALLCAVFRGMIDGNFPGCRQLSQSTMYPAPTPAGIPVRFEVETMETDGPSRRLALRSWLLEAGAEPVLTCQGETEIEI